jgi:hypothetical protein
MSALSDTVSSFNECLGDLALIDIADDEKRLYQA